MKKRRMGIDQKVNLELGLWLIATMQRKQKQRERIGVSVEMMMATNVMMQTKMTMTKRRVNAHGAKVEVATSAR